MLFNHHAAFHFDVLSPQIVVFLLIKDWKESEGKEEKHFLNCTLKETRPSVVELAWKVDKETPGDAVNESVRS